MNLKQHIAGWLLLLGAFLIPANAADLNVLLVLSDSKAIYQDFAHTFQQNLPANISTTVLQNAEDFKAQKTDLVVTVGVKAAQRVTGKTPVLAAMIPGNVYADLLANRKYPGPFSAVFLDQPWERQIKLLRAALPERRKIGVLHAAQIDISRLRELVKGQGATLFEKSLSRDDELFAALESVLENSEVLLGVPDADIYNSNNIRNILLSSYRRGIPLVGFSQGYVRAGALYALYSTPQQLAAQASDMCLQFSKTGKLPEAQYPSLYTIAVNQEVARTLGITIKSAESLQFQLEKSEGRLR